MNEGKDVFADFFARRMREALGSMPQVELRELLIQNGIKMTQQRLSHYMQGRNYPDPPILRELAKAMSVSIDWLVGLTDEPLPAKELNEMALTAKGEAHINKIMRAMSKERQRQIIAFAEFLLTQEQKEQARVTPTINALPLSERQRNLTTIKNMLDSIEQDHGTVARREMERTIREEFSNVDNIEK